MISYVLEMQRKKDCEQLAKWWNDGKVMAHAGFPNGLGTTATEIEKQIVNDSDETRRRLMIVYKKYVNRRNEFLRV